MAAQSTVQFALGGTTCSVEGPDGPAEVSTYDQWVTDQTADLTRIAYRTNNVNLTMLKINLNNLTKANYKLLRSFFYTTAKGPENAFTYTHTDGSIYSNCRFAMTKLDPKRINNNEYAVSLVMDVPGFFDP